MKKIVLLALLLSSTLLTKAQNQKTWGIKAGGGTSWLVFPKVFLQDPDDAYNTWEIAPATNSVTFYIGAEVIIPLGNHMAFRGELSYTYVSGEAAVSQIDTELQARKLQVYNRIEVPLLLTVKSNDNFWFSLGPNFFINVADNNGLVDAIHELAPDAPIDAKTAWGVRARLAANIQLEKHLYLEIKFDYDLGKHFKYSGDAYEVRMAMQGITGGLTYLF